jgi:predicted RNA binding protein YcfA (HicA-like mRNA interferase family)
MKLPRNVDGSVLASHLVKNWHYEHIRQTGSHLRLRTEEPTSHSITIPNHRPLKTGTLSSIVKDVAEHKGVPVDGILAGL